MTFRTYYKGLSKDEKRQLAEAANTSEKMLYHLAAGNRQAGISLAARLKQADPKISDTMLRPDLYPPAA